MCKGQNISNTEEEEEEEEGMGMEGYERRRRGEGEEKGCNSQFNSTEHHTRGQRLEGMSERQLNKQGCVCVCVPARMLGQESWDP